MRNRPHGQAFILFLSMSGVIPYSTSSEEYRQKYLEERMAKERDFREYKLEILAKLKATCDYSIGEFPRNLETFQELLNESPVPSDEACEANSVVAENILKIRKDCRVYFEECELVEVAKDEWKGKERLVAKIEENFEVVKEIGERLGCE